MDAVVGVFNTRVEAEQAMVHLKSAGIPDDLINLLTPAASQEQLHAVPTTEAEQPGIGGAMGGVVGGALGAAGGMGLGMAVAAMFIPGVGPVIAMGVLGAALLGTGGAVGGAISGNALEASMEEGLPKDELFVYEDALRQGRSVVIATTAEGKQTDAARTSMELAGADSIDSARESWWVGLRDAEEEAYTAEGHDFKTNEPNYRSGFEAALRPQTRGRSYDEVMNYLVACCPKTHREESFRRGYERGQAYHRNSIKKYEASA